MDLLGRGLMEKTSWLHSTSQGWKLWVFTVLVFVTGCSLVFLVLNVNGVFGLETFSILKIAFSSVALGVGSLLWLGLSIRCPGCGGKVAWHFLHSRRHTSWWIDLVSTRTCPLCGSSSSSDASV